MFSPLDSIVNALFIHPPSYFYFQIHLTIPQIEVGITELTWKYKLKYREIVPKSLSSLPFSRQKGSFIDKNIRELQTKLFFRNSFVKG